MPIDFSSLIAGAVGGILTSGTVRWWQYRRDLWLGRVERLCEVVEKAADSATIYWLTEPGKDKDHAFKKMEAGLLGQQNKFDRLLTSVQERWRKADQDEIFRLSASFQDGLNGGTFAGERKQIDDKRARAVQFDASELVVVIRIASDRSLTLWETIWHYIRKSARFAKAKLEKIC